MSRLILILLFILPFQARIYKILRPLSRLWIDLKSPFPTNFEPYAALLISDFLLIALLIGVVCLRKKLAWDLQQKSAMLFLGIALLSLLLHSSSPGISYFRLAHFALLFTLLFQTFPRFKTVALVIACSATLQCGLALTQYFSQHTLGLKVLGERALTCKGELVGAVIWMPKISTTVFDYYLGKEQEAGMIFRAAGTFEHPNLLASFLVVSLFMTLFLYEEKKKWVAILLFLQVVTLFATYSRGGLFALMGGAFLWACLHYLREKKVPTAVKPLMIAFACSTLLFFPQLFHRGGVFSQTHLSAGSDSARLEMQDSALRIIRDYPLLGVGFNNYLLTLPRYGGPPIVVHNTYLLIAAETGVVGVAAFLLFALVTALQGWRVRALPEGRICLALMIALLATGYVHFDIVMKHQIAELFFLTAALTGYLFRSTHVLKAGSSQCDLASGGRT